MRGRSLPEVAEVYESLSPEARYSGLRPRLISHLISANLVDAVCMCSQQIKCNSPKWGINRDPGRGGSGYVYAHDGTRVLRLSNSTLLPCPLFRRCASCALHPVALRIKLQMCRVTPFLVLGLWDKKTVRCAGAMPYRRDFPATTRI